MNIIQSIFRYKKAVEEKLTEYGFIKENGCFVFRTLICDGSMQLTVKVGKDVLTEVLDMETDEPYTLFLVESAEGEFVGKVRKEYICALEDIADKCFEKEVFKGAHTAFLIAYAREKYGSEPEFLWADTPDCAVLRRKDTKKWYAAILTVQYKKLGIERDGTVEIVDLRMKTEELEKTVDNKTYFRGWHMNKKHWVTMLLDGSAPIEELRTRLDESFLSAIK